MREDDEAFAALREAIEGFAVQRAPELVAEARAEAAARVRSMLSEAMAHALLDRARDELTTDDQRRPRPAEPAPPAASKPARRTDPRDEAPACYVYGVARASESAIPEDLAGVDPRHGVRLIEHDGLAAVASAVSLAEFGEQELRENLNDLEWLEEKARAHELVLEELLARTTVVPMRLCTIYRGEPQVRDMLAREHHALMDALSRLDGKTEWSVKLIAEPGALSRAASKADAGNGDEPALAAGAAYMRERGREARAREAIDRLAEEWTLAVHERLAANAVEALVNPLQNPEVSGHDGDMLLNGAYLVADGDLDPFQREVEALRSEYRPHGAAVEMSGPWPPYNFVERSIETTR